MNHCGSGVGHERWDSRRLSRLDLCCPKSRESEMEVRRCRNTSRSNTEIRQATIKQLRRGETLPIVTMPLCSPMGR